MPRAGPNTERVVAAAGELADEVLGRAAIGLARDDAIDAIRFFRSALHGFISLEANGGFGMPVSVDRSFDRLVHALVRAMSTWSDPSEPGRSGVVGG